MSPSIGAVTIGQSPRSDVVPELEYILGPDVRIVQAGALDRFSKAELQAILPATTGPVLVTRLRDGSDVKLGEDFLVPRMQECIRQLEDEADLILLLCTGTFPRLDSKRLILYPEQVLFNVVRGVGAQRVGIFTPAPEQIETQHERWRKVVPHVVVKAASPYGAPEQLENAALAFGRNDLDLVILDCIGYTQAMKTRVRALINRPVLLARSLVARLAAELIH